MKTKRLHPLELEVMKVVWKLTRATVNDVLDNIDRKLAYTTVATTMKSLEKKAFCRMKLMAGRLFISLWYKRQRLRIPCSAICWSVSLTTQPKNW